MTKVELQMLANQITILQALALLGNHLPVSYRVTIIAMAEPMLARTKSLIAEATADV